MSDTPILSIGNAEQRLGILPTLGASAAFWEVHRNNAWAPIWRPYAPTQGSKRIIANFALLPWSNRLMGGGITVDGQFYPMASNRPDTPCPTHGTAWMESWDVVHHSQTSIELALESRHACGYPWHFRATQRYAIEGAQMTMRLEVTHLGEARLPYGLAFHPYILRPQDGTDVRLQFAAQGYWEAEKSIPTVHSTAFPEGWNFSQMRALGHGKIDHNYTGCDGRMAMERSDIDLRIDWLTTEPAGLDLAILFRPEHDEWFCYEPVTHITDAFRHPGMPGLRLLEKGQSMALEVQQTLSHLR